MKQIALMLLGLLMAAPLCAQSPAPGALFLDGNGNPYPSGTGSTVKPPPYTCVTNVNGTYQFCDFSGSGGGPFTGVIIDKGGQVYNVKGYGAKVDGTTDDTVAVNAAQAAAVSAGGGIVFIPAGTMITQPIQGASNVAFEGDGAGQTTWELIAAATPVAPSGSGTCSTTASVIIECYTSAWSVSNLTIDGNTSNQTASTSYGIYVSANGYSPTGKQQPSISHVTVQFTKSDGIHIDFGSAGQGQHSNITVYGAGGVGIFAGSYDTQWTNINVGQSGLQGIYMAVSANHFTGVKSWFSGAVTPSAGTGILSVAGNNQCDSCEAQDNQFHGIYLDGATGNVFTGVVSTGNNRTSATTGVGVEIANGTDNIVVGNAQGGADFAASQLYAVEYSGSSANNHVRLTSSGNVTGLIHGTSTNEDVLVVDSSGTIQSQLLGTNINMTGPIVSTAYLGSINPSASAFQSIRIGNGTNTWFPTVQGTTGQFGLQDGSTLNNPFEIAEGAPSDSILINASGLTTIALSNSSTLNTGHTNIWTVPQEFAAGTTSLPSITSSVDTSSGFHFPASGQTAYSTGTFDQFIIANGAFALRAAFVLKWSNGTSPSTSTNDTCLERSAAGVVNIGTSTCGNGLGTVQVAAVLPGVIYSVAGTALPSCVTGLKGEKAVVSDATIPTFLGTYAGSGTVVSPVMCNGANWVTY